MTTATADAARHRAVFNVAIAPSRHAADIARTVIAFYLYVLQRHVLHLAAGADAAEQAHIAVTRRNGQPRDGMAAAVEGAGVWVVIGSYRRPVDACQVDVVVEGDVDVGITAVHLICRYLQSFTAVNGDGSGIGIV